MLYFYVNVVLITDQLLALPFSPKEFIFQQIVGLMIQIKQKEKIANHDLAFVTIPQVITTQRDLLYPIELVKCL